MIQIITADKTVLDILGQPKDAAGAVRFSKYCLSHQTDGGILLYNLLTGELVLLSAEEYASAPDCAYLRDHRFLVPSCCNEREEAELVRWVLKTRQKEPKAVTSFTILTTTDCNARCYYCYEKGCARVTMTPETADKVASYIQKQAAGKPVTLRWFGGEPLLNTPVIDRICQRLQQQGVTFRSHMVSNGYLFDDELVRRAADLWKLRQVQVTLDGTQAIYNRSKAYIYREGNPYETVTENIHRLLQAEISVVVRLNLGPHNGEDLLKLTKELAQRFKGQPRLKVYAHLLFDTAEADRGQLYESLDRLKACLAANGFSSLRQLPGSLPLNRCMADSGNAVVIAPGGQLGLCEHYTDSEFFGHIDTDARDEAVIAGWRQRCKPIPECQDCFYFPQCAELEKCPGRTSCDRYTIAALKRDTQQAMDLAYRRWLQKKE